MTIIFNGTAIQTGSDLTTLILIHHMKQAVAAHNEAGRPKSGDLA